MEEKVVGNEKEPKNGTLASIQILWADAIQKIITLQNNRVLKAGFRELFRP